MGHLTRFGGNVAAVGASAFRRRDCKFYSPLEMERIVNVSHHGTCAARCNGMREHYPRSSMAFLLTLAAVLIAAKLIFTSLFTRFAW